MDYLQQFGTNEKLAGQAETETVHDDKQMMKSFSVLARELNLHELADTCLAISQGVSEAPPFRVE